MIDTHCHLLPELDDGPPDLDTALALAAALAEHGVTFAVCTPHFSSIYPTDHLQALDRKASLARSLAAEGVELELVVAGEISPERAVTAHADELLARSIAGRFALVELLAETPSVSIATVHERLAVLGLTPIFAHPERCRALARGFAPLDDARREGALVQVVSSSLVGRWGEAVRAAAWRLIDTGRADLLASDAHHPGHAAAFHRASALVDERLGESVRRELTERRPGLVVSGTHPESVRRP